MADERTNDFADTDEVKAYKTQATGMRFKQQFAYGVGAAMVFGLVGAVATGLREAAAAHLAAGITSAGFLMPAIGLIGIAVLGAGLLYLSAKYLSNVMALDHTLQAKQIQAEKDKSRGQDKSPTVETTQPMPESPTTSFPLTGAAKSDAAETSADTTPEKKWTDQFEKSGKLDIAALKAANDDSKGWGEKEQARAAASPATSSLAAL